MSRPRSRVLTATFAAGAITLAATAAAALPTAGAAGTTRADEAPRAAAAAPPVSRSVTVDEGTNMAVAVSGDGTQLVTDLQGFLWTLPAAGGAATPRTDVTLDPALPDWSPTEDRIVFQAYRAGTYDLYTAGPDGSDVTALTQGPADDREPRFSPDGTQVAFASDRRGSYDIWVKDLADGSLTRWTDAATEEFTPGWSPDGDELAYAVGDAPAVAEPVVATTIEAVDATGAIRTVAVDDRGTVYSPSWSPDGDHLAYVVLTTDYRSRLVVDGQVVSGTEDVFPFPVEWTGPDEFVYTASGDIRRRTLAGDVETIPFTATLDIAREGYERAQHPFDATAPRPVRGISAPKLSPDGQQVAFTALGDLWLLTVGDPVPQRLTRSTYLEADPTWSADGSRLVYTSDRAGSPDLYIHTLATGEDARLTRRPGAELGAAISPDGSAVAFQDHEGATFVTYPGTGQTVVVDEARWLPGHPSWAPDSRTLALAAWDPVSDRYREGTSKILLVDTEDLSSNLVPPAPVRSLSTRGLDGPVWSPDGTRLAFVMESTLWVRPVDETTGLPTGPAVQVSNEVTDAPSWSGDSSTLLYLSNGRLRTVPADGTAAPSTVPLRLSWTPKQHAGRVVVHAGRLWDGVSTEVRRNVDVVVRANRIVSVRAHDPATHAGAGEVVAAGRRTVLPGLIDSHIHNELWGTAFGARKGRLYLAYGVTTARSLGDQVYQAKESEESYEAGTQVGPRYLATGEAIDGSRVYYDFMRPTLDADQLRDLELPRARALSYDILKSYVRLPADLNRILVRAAHAMGVPALSHYLYPGVAFGQDGQSHVSATQRLGYSRSQSLAGVSYTDMTRLFGRSRTTVVPTLFDSSSLLAEAGSYVADPRATGLLPSWEFALLADEAHEAASTDQTAVRRLLRLEVQALRGVLANGGVVSAGTDAPLDQVGLSTHLNLRAMVRYGMTPYEALRTATAVAAEEIGEADDLGTVRPGNLADLVAVAGNPLRDITRTDDVGWVMKGGRQYSVPQLLAPYRRLSGSARSLVAEPASAAPALLARRLPPTVLDSGEH